MPISRIAPARLRARHAADPRPSRERRDLWIVQSLASAAQASALVVAIVWAVTAGAGSAGIGLVVAAGLAALAVATRPAAHLVERRSRRSVMAVSQLGAGCALLALGTLAPPELWRAVVLSAVAGACRAAFDAASVAIVHHHTPDGRTRAALADLTHRHAFAHLTGVAAALPLAVVEGPATAGLAAAAMWLLGGTVAVALHPTLDTPSAARPAMPGAMGEALAEVASRRRPLLASVVDLGACMAGGAAATLVFPELAASIGLTRAAFAVSAALLAVLLARPAVARATRGRLSGAMSVGMLLVAFASVGAATAGGVALAALSYGGLVAGAAICAAAGRRARSGLDVHLHAPTGLASGALAAAAGASGALLGGTLGGVIGLEATLWLLAIGASMTAAATATAMLRGQPAGA